MFKAKSFKKIKDKKAIAMMAIAFVLLLFIPIYYFVFIPFYTGNAPISVKIEEGQGSRSIAKLLKEKGLIRSEIVFTSYLKLTGQDDELKAGKYNFSGRLDVPGVVFILVNGLSETEDIRLLVSEGFNVWEIDKRLVSLGLIKEGEFSYKFYQDEGYLFPDTYRLNQLLATSSYEITESLRQRMGDNFKEKIGELFKNLTKEEQKRIIIVASMLEKEARTEKDMKLVAGIIYKRMELGMLLQIDATVIYGACYRQFHSQVQDLGSRIQNCDVTYQGVARELKIDGAYNSYIRKGLPPGPISSPGLKAIQAALNPTKSDYLYYLSTRDGATMIYSKTSGEHVANRRKYLGI